MKSEEIKNCIGISDVDIETTNEPPIKIWIVMVEQHYAGEECVLAVCSDEETADRVKAESKLGDDVHIYESHFNVLYPTV